MSYNDIVAKEKRWKMGNELLATISKIAYQVHKTNSKVGYIDRLLIVGCLADKKLIWQVAIFE